MDDMEHPMWPWIFLRVIFAIVLAVLVFNLLLNFTGQQMMPYPDWIWNLVGILVFVLIVSWILRWPWYHGYGYGYGHEMRILRRRYARGEITEAQFKRMAKVLRSEMERKD